MNHRRGYILLTVLLLLMLAAVAMASLCRLAIAKSLVASAASDELQRRWGTISCRDALLPNARNLLDNDESISTPVTRLHAAFKLCDESFAVDISDEQAKVNVNALYAIQGRDRAEQSIRSLVTASGADLKPRLRLMTSRELRPKPTASSTIKDAQSSPEEAEVIDHFPPVFGSWSEVFPDVQVASLLPSTPGSISDSLTCWGDGRLNIRRASVVSITQVCSPTLSPLQISQLLVLRNRLGDHTTVEQMLAGVHADTADSLNLSGRLTVTSATQSLWITSSDHSATQHNLIIFNASNSDDPRSFAFRW